MKTRIYLFLIVITWVGHLNRAAAQGTSAFTYQGQLVTGGSPANGTYDFTFALFNNDSTNTGQVGNIVTNFGVGVTNGLFTTSLDFGAVFGSNANWLAIDVRTNGAAKFTALSPLQQVTPTPYALYAPSAGAAETATTASVANSVAGTNITGTVSPANLPGTLVTNSEINVTLNGAFSGNGSGLTNLPASGIVGLPSTSGVSSVNSQAGAVNIYSSVVSGPTAGLGVATGSGLIDLIVTNANNLVTTGSAPTFSGMTNLGPLEATNGNFLNLQAGSEAEGGTGNYDIILTNQGGSGLKFDYYGNMIIVPTNASANPEAYTNGCVFFNNPNNVSGTTLAPLIQGSVAYSQVGASAFVFLGVNNSAEQEPVDIVPADFNAPYWPNMFDIIGQSNRYEMTVDSSAGIQARVVWDNFTNITGQSTFMADCADRRIVTASASAITLPAMGPFGFNQAGSWSQEQAWTKGLSSMNIGGALQAGVPRQATILYKIQNIGSSVVTVASADSAPFVNSGGATTLSIPPYTECELSTVDAVNIIPALRPIGNVIPASLISGTLPPTMCGGQLCTLSTFNGSDYCPWSGGNYNATESWVEQPVTRAGTVTNLFVVSSASVSAGTNYSCTLYHNGGATAVTCIVTSALATPNDTKHSFTVAVGDTMTIHFQSNASISSPRIMWAFNIQ